VTNYRPISLTPIAAKMLESLQLNRFEQIWDKHMADATNQQSGFTRGKGARDQIFRVRQAALQANKQRAHRAIAFLDISKAFDRVWVDGLIYQIILLGIFPVADIHWLRAFLTQRRLRVIYRGIHSEWFTLSAGVPQGCILSPFLFKVFIHILAMQSTYSVDCLGALFADDIAIWAASCGSDGDTDLNSALSSIENFAKKFRVQFNLEKCKILRFYSDLSTQPHHPIIFFQSPLSEVKSFRYLGVTFDSGTSFDNHVHSQVAKANSAVQSLIPILSKTLFLSTARRVLLMRVMPIVTYCIGAWRPRVKQLQILFRPLLTGLRQLCRLSKSTSTDHLLQSFAIPSPLATFNLQCLKLALHLETLPLSEPSRQAWITEPNHRAKFSHAVSRAKNFFNILDSTVLTAPLLLSISKPPEIPFFLNRSRYSSSKLRLRIWLKQSNLRHHLFTKHLINSPSCRFCLHRLNQNISETPDHIFFHCPLYHYPRTVLISSLHSLQLNISAITVKMICGISVPLIPASHKRFFLSITSAFLASINFIRGPL